MTEWKKVRKKTEKTNRKIEANKYEKKNNKKHVCLERN